MPSKLWIFGDSLSCAYNTSISWPELLADRIGYDLLHMARPAVDNFFIYQSFLNAINQIGDKDLVIIGWTHPNRKMWIADPNNKKYQSFLEHSLCYESNNRIFFRFNGRDRERSLNLNLNPSGIEFYDNWYDNYFNSYEQRCLFGAMVGHTEKLMPEKLQFFFSKESIENVSVESDLFALDFIQQSRCYISEKNCHFNEEGHELWSDILYKKYVMKIV
jgi:hypothetical protein